MRAIAFWGSLVVLVGSWYCSELVGRFSRAFGALSVFAFLTLMMVVLDMVQEFDET